MKEFPKEPSLSDTIIKACLETIESSTFHGFTNIMRNKHSPVKVLWVLFMTFSAAYCAYSIYECISAFLKYQVVTQVDIVYKNKVVFPIVKICRNDLAIPGHGSSPIITNKVQMLQASLFQENLMKSYDDTVKSQIGIQNLSDILITCTFNLNFCNVSEFGYYYDFHYGSCYRFNTGKDKNGNQIDFKSSAQIGLLNGLQLEFYVGQASENTNLFSIENGLNILISNDTTDSTTVQGLRVSTGMVTNVILNQYSISLQPKPYSTCVDDLTHVGAYSSECYKKTFLQAQNQSKAYYSSDCTLTCFQKYLGDVCKCQSLLNHVPFYENLRKCTLVTDMECVYKSWTKMNQYPSILEECDCPLECSRTYYSFSSSFSAFPTKSYAKILASSSLIKSKLLTDNQTEIDFDKLSNSVVAVNIFYDELKETIISYDIRMSSSDLLGAVGGTLGLFLGMSLLTFAEILEIILQSLIILIKAKSTSMKKTKTKIETKI